ncbi:MAG: hypothetical protein R3B46_01320 [Phycisphaerales bacterium]
MRIDEVIDMDVIADACAVGRGVVGAEDGDVFAVSEGGFAEDGDDADVGDAVLSQEALGIAAGDIEVAEDGAGEGFVGTLLRIGVVEERPFETAVWSVRRG